MAQTETHPDETTDQTLYQRIESKLGIKHLRSDSDLATLVERRLPVQSVLSLTKHGLAEGEVYALILPRRTLTHRRAKRQLLTREESDRAVRLARITALAEEVFGSEEKAFRWLRKPKRRFGSRTPLEMLVTEAGSRLVEELLYQIDEGMAA
jgi:putative toxin-antitoxin system antitoxin component (TIGR02293 family)